MEETFDVKHLKDGMTVTLMKGIKSVDYAGEYLNYDHHHAGKTVKIKTGGGRTSHGMFISTTDDGYARWVRPDQIVEWHQEVRREEDQKRDPYESLRFFN